MTSPISLTSAARVFFGFVGASELFGQLFFGTYSIAHSVIGVGSVLLALLFPAANPRVVLTLVSITGAAVLLAAYDYYERLDVPGNDFAWPLRAPFLFALTFVAWRSSRAISSQRRGHEG